MLFWCLCFVAFVAFMLSCVVSASAARLSIRFWSAICAVLATTAVQKLSLLQLVLILLQRKHSICANVVEFLLGASDWAHSVLALVAAWTGQSKIVPASLVGAIAVNHLVLIGVCFVNGVQNNNETRYPFMMAAIHARLLPAVLATLVCAGSANAWPGVSDERILRVYCVTSAILLLVFAVHIIHVCTLNSWIVQAADPLLRLSDCNNRDHYASRVSEKTDAAGVSQLRHERQKWLYDCGADPEMPGSNHGQHQFWDTVLVIALLLVSCGASFGSCVQLLSSLAPDGIASFQSSLHVGYVFFPISTCAAGVVAVQLHGNQRRSGWCSDSILYSAVISVFRLICFVLPTFVLTRWATASLESIEFLYGYQVGLLAIAVLVPVYAMQNDADNWYVTSDLAMFQLICFQAYRNSSAFVLRNLYALCLVDSRADDVNK
ncbi:hypothetical protein COCC4DRAFT_62957 [Bipolaris maydis ATCC 48331]|uniref:Sodium/calcium exchanger membrane region domain-containing protein n=2 Tax=Cochliobolus heterostrophus TaxID=5016 RepID=M2UFI9_COCH5|nr:uncharacterized protein COCC4DRAFT_62957 [Bipolaris maydis ATCC 48331]EMD86758.1 hypothetical protein COCHEDRAFT_1034524 [Bipolaris maydis C5]KAJ6203668.1 hypothetical protein PSV09DRAFT_1034524 [Bipolaris maydis]ENI03151.1 hypothetical protein COCC4DRAFT_62957 [Bipolaris maydis ATCC 48331]KAJ6267333.1 hypothetical protein PSV08DRAFT_187173 [Bipolaris maydis]KAJ6267709.1 hypothetical protein PSV08DRAFT_373778 [Bipolaris maydis]